MDENEFNVPDELRGRHDEVRSALEAIGLMPSGKWSINIQMAQLAKTFEMVDNHFKGLISSIYDLSRSNDKSLKLDAIRKFISLQIDSLHYMLSELLDDINNPDSGFYNPKRKKFTSLFHQVFRLKDEGVPTEKAWEAAAKTVSSTPEEYEEFMSSIKLAKDVFDELMSSGNKSKEQKGESDDDSDEGMDDMLDRINDILKGD